MYMPAIYLNCHEWFGYSISVHRVWMGWTQFRKELEDYKQSIPAPYLLRLLAKELIEESRDARLSIDKRLQQRSASLFLDYLAQKETRSWFLKKLENYTKLKIGTIVTTSLLVGVAIQKASYKPKKKPFILDDGSFDWS